MKQFWNTLAICLTVFAIIMGIIGMFVLDYTAFKQQFPNANLFTYIMRG